MTGGPADPSAATLERLRLAYAARLEDKVAEIEACWRREPPDLIALERAAHGLAGTSGTFGFGEISRRAALIEDLLGSARAAGRSPASSAVEAEIQALRSSLP